MKYWWLIALLTVTFPATASSYPVVCLWCTCGDLSGEGDCAVTEVDYIYLLSECGNPAHESNSCADVLNRDGYVDVFDLLAWSSMFHDQLVLNPCTGPSAVAGGSSSSVNVGNAAVVIAGKPGSGGQNDALYPVDAITHAVGTSIPASVQNSGLRSGHNKLAIDSGNSLHQLHGSFGLVRLADGVRRLTPQTGTVNSGMFIDPPIPFSGTALRVGPTASGGYFLTDIAFDPVDSSIVYVVPVQVDPPVNGSDPGCPYRAAAKLQLTSGGNFNVLKIYGKNPYPGSVVIGFDCSDFTYSPDASGMREVEVDSFGNLFVSSAQGVNDQNYVLIYPANGGPEIRVSISTNVHAPVALRVDGSKLYVSTSLDGADTTNTSIWRYTINLSGNNATGLAFDTIINTPGMRFITDMRTSPIDGKLWAIGYNADTCSTAECLAGTPCPGTCSYSSSDIFTTPRLAVITNPATTPGVSVSTMTGGNLALPLALLFTPCGYGDFDGGGTEISDIAPFVAALINPSGPDLCAGDLNGDGVLNARDIQKFVDILTGP